MAVAVLRLEGIKVTKLMVSRVKDASLKMAPKPTNDGSFVWAFHLDTHEGMSAIPYDEMLPALAGSRFESLIPVVRHAVLGATSSWDLEPLLMKPSTISSAKPFYETPSPKPPGRRLRLRLKPPDISSAKPSTSSPKPSTTVPKPSDPSSVKPSTISLKPSDISSVKPSTIFPKPPDPVSAKPPSTEGQPPLQPPKEEQAPFNVQATRAGKRGPSPTLAGASPMRAAMLNVPMLRFEGNFNVFSQFVAQIPADQALEVLQSHSPPSKVAKVAPSPPPSPPASESMNSEDDDDPPGFSSARGLSITELYGEIRHIGPVAPNLGPLAPSIPIPELYGEFQRIGPAASSLGPLAPSIPLTAEDEDLGSESSCISMEAGPEQTPPLPVERPPRRTAPNIGARECKTYVVSVGQYPGMQFVRPDQIQSLSQNFQGYPNIPQAKKVTDEVAALEYCILHGIPAVYSWGNDHLYYCSDGVPLMQGDLLPEATPAQAICTLRLVLGQERDPAWPILALGPRVLPDEVASHLTFPDPTDEIHRALATLCHCKLSFSDFPSSMAPSAKGTRRNRQMLREQRLNVDGWSADELESAAYMLSGFSWTGTVQFGNRRRRAYAIIRKFLHETMQLESATIPAGVAPFVDRLPTMVTAMSHAIERVRRLASEEFEAILLSNAELEADLQGWAPLPRPEQHAAADDSSVPVLVEPTDQTVPPPFVLGVPWWLDASYRSAAGLQPLPALTFPHLPSGGDRPDLPSPPTSPPEGEEGRMTLPSTADAHEADEAYLELARREELAVAEELEARAADEPSQSDGNSNGTDNVPDLVFAATDSEPDVPNVPADPLPAAKGNAPANSVWAFDECRPCSTRLYPPLEPKPVPEVTAAPLDPAHSDAAPATRQSRPEIGVDINCQGSDNSLSITIQYGDLVPPSLSYGTSTSSDAIVYRDLVPPPITQAVQAPPALAAPVPTNPLEGIRQLFAALGTQTQNFLNDLDALRVRPATSENASGVSASPRSAFTATSGNAPAVTTAPQNALPTAGGVTQAELTAEVARRLVAQHVGGDSVVDGQPQTVWDSEPYRAMMAPAGTVQASVVELMQAAWALANVNARSSHPAQPLPTVSAQTGSSSDYVSRLNHRGGLASRSRRTARRAAERDEGYIYPGSDSVHFRAAPHQGRGGRGGRGRATRDNPPDSNPPGSLRPVQPGSVPLQSTFTATSDTPPAHLSAASLSLPPRTRRRHSPDTDWPGSASGPLSA